MAFLNYVFWVFFIVYAWTVEHSHLLISSYQDVCSDIVDKTMFQLHFECQITIWNYHIVQCHNIELDEVCLVVCLNNTYCT